MRLHRKFVPLLFLCVAAPCLAAAHLPRIFSDGMVLQRNAPIHVWGIADPGERVHVSLAPGAAGNKGAHREADAIANPLGSWSVYLAPTEAVPGSYALSVRAASDPALLVLSDIAIGDVWLASGQSNMEMPLSGWDGAPLKNSAQEIAAANHPELRLFVAPRSTPQYPATDFASGAWTHCTPETAAHFSAAAYFFGREIAEREHVTVGVIDSTWGGTPAEAWTSLEGIAADPALNPVWTTWDRFSRGYSSIAAVKQAEAAEDAAAAQAGKPKPKHPWHPDAESYRPGAIFNGMVAPLTPLTLRGVIWYQGETNSALERSTLYYPLFSALIRDWRQQFHQGAFPFLFAQISASRSTPAEAWGVLRDAQRRTLSVANTAMAVTTDVGTPDNVHPPDKQTVGHRLALAARALSYGESIHYAGPLFTRADVEGNTIRIGFQDRLTPLTCAANACTGFEVAGADHHFVPAEAHVDGSSVVASSASVSDPLYVRYAWPNAPVANLFDATGLPASTFTSEDTLAITGPLPTALTHD